MIRPTGQGPFPHESLDAPTVFLVRHGETKLNAKTVTKGWMDEPLDENGQQQADELGKELSKYPITHIISSSLTRATHTAEIINQHIGADSIEPSNNLLPWQPGVLTGTMGKQAEQAIKHFASNPDEAPPTGESFHQFISRWSPVLQQAMQQAHQGKVPLLLVHSRQMQTLPYIMSHGKEPILYKDGPDPGTAVMLQDHGKGFHLVTPDDARTTD